MRTVLILILIVGASIVVAVAGLWLVRTSIAPHHLKPNNEVAGNYLQTVGTVYAVLLAFVVFVVWTQQNEAGQLVERQADELADVLRLTRQLGEPVSGQAALAARDYLREVIEEEWDLLAAGQASPRAVEGVERLWRTLAAVEPKTPREEALYAEAVGCFNEFSNARSDLLQNSRTRLPPTLWILLVTGGLSTVSSMYLFGLEEFWPLAAMTAGLAGAVSFVLFLIYDLDHAFAGDWRVRTDPLRDLLARIESDAGRAAAAGTSM